jgi:hypothetical protein
MDVLLVVGIFAALAGVAFAAYFISQKLEQQRTDKIRLSASELGLEYAPQGDPALLDRLGSLNLFGQGRDRRMTNLLFGETDECRISIFDYRYTVGSGKQTKTLRMTIAVLESPRLNIPAFTLRPENLFDKVGGLLGFQDIDFVDHPLFSNRFVLKGPDEEGIRKFFNKPLLDFFAERLGSSVEAIPGLMIYYTSNQRRKPEHFAPLLEEAYKVYGVIVDR